MGTDGAGDGKGCWWLLGKPLSRARSTLKPGCEHKQLSWKALPGSTGRGMGKGTLTLRRKLPDCSEIPRRYPLFAIRWGLLPGASTPQSSAPPWDPCLPQWPQKALGRVPACSVSHRDADASRALTGGQAASLAWKQVESDLWQNKNPRGGRKVGEGPERPSRVPGAAD